MAAMRSAEQDVDVDLGALFGAIRRDWLRIALVTLGVALGALVFAMIATPKYSGETRILIETRESVFTRPQQANGDSANSAALDEEGVTSQVEVISSNDVLKKVIDKLHLADRPEFDAAKPSVIGSVLIAFGLKTDQTALVREDRVLKAFRDRLKVYRVDKSRVLVIEFSSVDPQLAADVPNAVADAYIALQRDANLQSNTDATGWLEPEIADLRQRVKDAEAKVAAYRSNSDLLIGQNNSVLATQQLSELSSELSRVRAARAAADSKAASVEAAIKAGTPLDTVPDVLSSGLIQRLRERQVQLNADIADLSTTLLDNHPRIKALRSQLADLDIQIRREALKVLQSLKTEASTAQMRERQLTGDLNQLKVESSRAGDQEVELRALEREAASQRDLLESYLTRYREASSRSNGNYLPADARIFSRANVPSEPYFPKVIPILGAAIAGSLLVMGIVTLLGELFSGRAMRPAHAGTGRPVEETTIVVADEPILAESVIEPAIEESGVDEDEPSVPVITALEPGIAPEKPQLRTAFRSGQLSIEAAVERLVVSGATRAVVVSPEGDEAAATSVLIAREVADAGLHVLLLDLTASGAASRPMLDSVSRPGITNLLASESQFTDVIHADHYSPCHVIPVGTADPVKAMRAAERLPIILASLATAYDLVVVECGPADAAGIRRLAGEGAEVLVSFIEPDDESIDETEQNLKAGGFARVMLVTPVDRAQPSPPVPDRSAA